MTAQSQSVPVYASITAANINDIEDGRKIPIEAGATYVFDKGYYDYNWWHRIHKSDEFFVSRFKYNAATTTVNAFDCGTNNSDNILEDNLVEFKHRRPRAKHINQYFGTPVRRIVVKREDKLTPIVLVTND